MALLRIAARCRPRLWAPPPGGAAEADAIMSVSICEFPVEAEFPTNLEKKPRAHFSLILFQDT